MANTSYIAIEGERWDTIAFKAYGNALQFNEIIDANPSISIVDVFEGGEKLIIPIIEVSATTDKSLLPPWKRVSSVGELTAAATAPLLLNIKSSGGVGSFDQSFD